MKVTSNQVALALTEIEEKKGNFNSYPKSTINRVRQLINDGKIEGNLNQVVNIINRDSKVTEKNVKMQSTKKEYENFIQIVGFCTAKRASINFKTTVQTSQAILKEMFDDGTLDRFKNSNREYVYRIAKY